MQTIHPIKPENMSIATKRLLDAESEERGVLSNMIKTLAQSPCALEGYVDFRRAVNGTTLSPAACEQIALVVAQVNLCEYSLAEHAYRAARLGLKPEQILESREARAKDNKTNAVLRFARELTARRGESSLIELRENGCSDAEIIEIVAHVALNIFENYLNDVARTALDFPKAAYAVKAA